MCLALGGIDPNVADDEGRTALHGAAHKGRTEVIQLLVDHGAKLDAHDGGSRDSINGALPGKTWIPLDWARGLVRVGVQSAIPHPEAERLLIKLMTERGLAIPPPPGFRHLPNQRFQRLPVILHLPFLSPTGWLR